MMNFLFARVRYEVGMIECMGLGSIGEWLGWWCWFFLFKQVKIFTNKYRKTYTTPPG